MLLLIKYTLLYGIVLMLVALGGMFSEHSGVINIALEGIMLSAAWQACWLPHRCPPPWPRRSSFWLPLWQQRSAACFTRCCWRLLPST
mgnify:FL=1